MKWYYLAALICISGYLQAADVTCNERARHGRVGLGKLLLAAVGGIGVHHMMGEFKEAAQQWRSGKLSVVTYDDEDAWKRTCRSAIALAAVGYVTYKLVSESYTSLGIFLDDDEEEDEIVKDAQEVEEPAETASE